MVSATKMLPVSEARTKIAKKPCKLPKKGKGTLAKTSALVAADSNAMGISAPKLKLKRKRAVSVSSTTEATAAKKSTENPATPATDAEGEKQPAKRRKKAAVAAATKPDEPPKKKKKKKKAVAPGQDLEGVPGLELHMQNCPGYLRDHHVHKAFESLGEGAVTKIKMETRPGTGTFLRSAFVKFKTRQLAEKAMAMPPPEIQGRVVRLSWPKPYVDKNSLDLFLRGWPRFAKDFHVYDRYAMLGPSAVTAVRWLPAKGNRLSCFVQFNSTEERDRALAAGNFVFNQATIVVERPTKTLNMEEREKAKEDAHRCELFIEPCFRDVTNDMLLTYYQELGKTAVVQIRRHLSRAWVVFKTPELALQAARMGPHPALKKINVRVKLNKR